MKFYQRSPGSFCLEAKRVPQIIRPTTSVTSLLLITVAPIRKDSTSAWTEERKVIPTEDVTPTTITANSFPLKPTAVLFRVHLTRNIEKRFAFTAAGKETLAV